MVLQDAETRNVVPTKKSLLAQRKFFITDAKCKREDEGRCLRPSSGNKKRKREPESTKTQSRHKQRTSIAWKKTSRMKLLQTRYDGSSASTATYSKNRAKPCNNTKRRDCGAVTCGRAGERQLFELASCPSTLQPPVLSRNSIASLQSRGIRGFLGKGFLEG